MASIVGLLAALAAAAPAQERITFSEHIAPILHKHCVGCHRPAGPTPFLISYDDVRQRATLVAQATLKRYMPPWKPDAPSGTFVGERRLTEERDRPDRPVGESAARLKATARRWKRRTDSAGWITGP